MKSLPGLCKLLHDIRTPMQQQQQHQQPGYLRGIKRILISLAEAAHAQCQRLSFEVRLIESSHSSSSGSGSSRPISVRRVLALR